MTVSHNLTYHFMCEKCGTQSPVFSATLQQGEAAVRVGRKELRRGGNAKTANKMLAEWEARTKMPQKNLNKTIKSLQGYLSSNERVLSNPFLCEQFNETFSSHICQHCGHAQTWYPAVSELPSRLRSARAWAIGFALFGIVADMLLHGFILFADWNILLYGGAGAIIGAAIGALKASAQKRKLNAHWNSTSVHNKPIVEWSETDEAAENVQENDVDDDEFLI